MQCFVFNLLVFDHILLGAHGAELFSLLIGCPEVVLGHPQVKDPDAVGAHQQHGVGHQLKQRSGRSGPR